MNNLGAFLAVFETMLKTEEGSKLIFKEVFKEVLGVSIELSNISVEEFRLYLDVHPVLKNEIMLHKEEIISILSKKTGNNFDSIT